jgi:hypothetical protein
MLLISIPVRKQWQKCLLKWVYNRVTGFWSPLSEYTSGPNVCESRSRNVRMRAVFFPKLGLTELALYPFRAKNTCDDGWFRVNRERNFLRHNNTPAFLAKSIVSQLYLYSKDFSCIGKTFNLQVYCTKRASQSLIYHVVIMLTGTVRAVAQLSQ